MRIRCIKPEFWSDEKLAALAPIHRLVFVGLWSIADDHGRLVDNLKLIDGHLFPLTEESAKDSLALLASMGRIIRYSADNGQRVLEIVNWKRHQKIDRPSKSHLPAPSGAQYDAFLISVATDSANPIEGVSNDSRNPREDSSRDTREDSSRDTREDSSRDTRENASSDSSTDLGSRILDLGDQPRIEQQCNAADAATPETPVESAGAVVQTTLPGVGVVVAEISGGMVVSKRRVKVKLARNQTADDVVSSLREALAIVEAKADERRTVDEIRAFSASIIFAYWAKKLHHDRALFDDERERILVKRLKENHDDVDELLYVVDGALLDPYANGTSRGSTGKKDGIALIFASRSKVEELASLVAGYKRKDPHPMTTRYQQLVADRNGGADTQTEATNG